MYLLLGVPDTAILEPLQTRGAKMPLPEALDKQMTVSAAEQLGGAWPDQQEKAPRTSNCAVGA
jgi:hypothetical protein